MPSDKKTQELVDKTPIDQWSIEQIVKVADEKGEQFTNIKTHQIRNFFSAVSDIRQKLKLAVLPENDKNAEVQNCMNSLVLLKPKLAYASRNGKVKDLYEFINPVIDNALKSENKEKALEHFILLVESIVAYHKFHGGKDN